MKQAILLALFTAGFAAAQDTKVKLPTTRNDLARGEKLYEGHCALCHGAKGGGGRGPMLTQARFHRAPDDTALVKIIEEGIRGTEMPGAWALSERERLQVAGFVRSLGRVPVKPVPGDAAQGARLYASKGACAACHAIQGQGGLSGPALDGIGARRSAAYLREALIDPQAQLPDSFAQVRAIANDGAVIAGIRLGEDSFAIQIRDAAGKMQSYWKSGLKEIVKDLKSSPMPSYKDKLSEAELTDVVAYLAGLRERP
jgi:cytochrome c oxidase cbb3-type subunit III